MTIIPQHGHTFKERQYLPKAFFLPRLDEEIFAFRISYKVKINKLEHDP
jgi:hypothetical protein